MRWHNYGYRPYVPVAQRRLKAQRHVAALSKKGKSLNPVHVEGRAIARTFWGKAWCENLESYMDYANRLPRGRSYVRNGSVIHLDIQPGRIEASVFGSTLYQVGIRIQPTARDKWKTLCAECAGGIGSLMELLQGRLSNEVMGVLTRRSTGLFPSPAEIELSCSCPDWAVMCKHVAAVLYGVGARLDQSPELLFTLRTVNHEELITQAATAGDLTIGHSGHGQAELDENELGAVFGIELDTLPAAAAAPKSVKQPARPRARSSKSPRAAASRGRRAKQSQTPAPPAPSKPGKSRRPVAKKK